LSGTVLMPPRKLPDGDEMALITDSEGLTVGARQAARRAEAVMRFSLMARPP
jgi:predicted enzyme related to lactoylglutathione lyase